MAFKFEKLRVWLEAMDLSDLIYEISLKIPSDEKYGMRSQITRAADSVVLNIAEGSVGQSDAEQHRFINYAKRSAIEVVSALYILKRRKMIQESEFLNLYNKYERLVVSLQAMMIYLKKSTKKTHPTN